MRVHFLHPDDPFFPEPVSVGLEIFDANGPEHGRSECGVKWVLEIRAVDLTKEMSLYEAHAVTGMRAIFPKPQTDQTKRIRRYPWVWRRTGAVE